MLRKKLCFAEDFSCPCLLGRILFSKSNKDQNEWLSFSKINIKPVSLGRASDVAKRQPVEKYPAAMPQPLSLRVKLPLSILAAVLITFSVSTLFVLHTSRAVISYVKSSRLEDAARAAGQGISMQIQRAGRDMVMVATLPTVLEGIDLPPQASPDSAHAAARTALSSLLGRVKSAYGYYDSLYLVDDAGRLLAGTSGQTTLSEEETTRIFQEAFTKNTFAVSLPVRSPTSDEVVLPTVLKLVYNGKSGALVGALQLSKITRESLRDAALPGISPIVIAREKDTVTLIGSTDKQELASGSWLDEIHDRVSGSMVMSVRGETKTIGFYHIPRTNLYSVVVADESYMQSYMRDIQHAIVAANILAAMIAVGCVCFFVFPVTRDILSLSLFVKDVTEGKEHSTTGVRRKDELGNLANSLDVMVATLTEMIARSQAAAQAKSEFLARMSHEIRTPMNGIIGTTYLAMQDSADAKQMEYLRRIDDISKTLLGVINDILDFSKIESGKMEIRSETFRLSHMLSSVRNMLVTKSEEKGLTLDFSVAENVPDVLEADPLRLSQICMNLCSNAIKFTESGSVSLHVSLTSRPGDELVLLFMVTDTGIGMSSEEQEHIFDSFSQADGSITRKYGGTGLGLAICKKFVHMMGGEIALESESGAGSAFFFSIRAKAGNSAQLNEDTPPVAKEQEALPELRVLLVEDNAINQKIALMVLKKMGASVSLAQNGAEAVRLWESESFDLILMDIQMPVMDGLTATRQIRASAVPRSRIVPIIAMTANAMGEDREKSFEAGMNDHLTKPLDIAELHSALARWGSVAKGETT